MQPQSLRLLESACYFSPTSRDKSEIKIFETTLVRGRVIMLEIDGYKQIWLGHSIENPMISR